MNHFALTLGAEEPDVTSISIRPGMVDTNMQRELREDHATNMTPEMHAKFTGVHADGKLLRVEQPSHVMAKLVLDAPKELSGKFLSYVDGFFSRIFFSYGWMLTSPGGMIRSWKDFRNKRI